LINFLKKYLELLKMKAIKLWRLGVMYFFALFVTTGAAVQIPLPLVPNGPLNEKILNIPGDPERPLTLQVTVFTPDGPGPFPLAVENHGGAGDDLPLEMQPRHRASYLANYFLSRGYAVVLPMMRGFAGSGGKQTARECDLEAVGVANAKDIRAVISYMATQSNIDSSRIVVAGRNLGGWSTLAFGTLDYPDVKGLINFSGGAISSTCSLSESALSNIAQHYGKKTKIPSLWFYGDNDEFIPVETWRSMHQAYVAAGGDAELVAYGKFMDDGHAMLRYPEALSIWTPKVDAFLTKVGFPGKLIDPGYMPADFPPSTHYAAIDDIDAVPYLSADSIEGYKRFLDAPMPRVFAIKKNGASITQLGGFDPVKEMLSHCQDMNCQLYAVDNEVVWVRPASMPPATDFAPLNDQNAVPYLDKEGRQAYLRFLKMDKPRAFVIAPNGSAASVSGGDDSAARAMKICARKYKGCRLYAVDNNVVWPKKTVK
jgi:dienelactone hydrolase